MSDLVKVENLVPAGIFKAGGTKTIIDKIKEEVEKFVPDLSTDKSRKEIASMAAKVARSKTFLDTMGKNLKTDNKAIDAERRVMRDELDGLRDKTRQPLTEWEEEQTRISNEKKARVKWEAEMEESREKYDKALIDAYYDNDMFDREKKMQDFEAKILEEKQAVQDEEDRLVAERIAKEEAERDELARIDYEAKVKKEADERAVKDYEESLLREQQEKERIVREKEEAEKQAKIDAENAEKKRLQDIEDAKVKAKKEQDAALEKQRKDQEEKERLEREKKQKEQDEIDRLARNRNHQKAINNRVVKKLISIGLQFDDFDTISEELAQGIVKELVKNPIPEISINYGGVK